MSYYDESVLLQLFLLIGVIRSRHKCCDLTVVMNSKAPKVDTVVAQEIQVRKRSPSDRYALRHTARAITKVTAASSSDPATPPAIGTITTDKSFGIKSTTTRERHTS